MSNILITGASSGIGFAIAKQLSEQGHTVFGTSRNPKPNLNLPFTMLELDVTNDASVQACVQRVIELSTDLDILINNAGYDLYGAAEETSDSELRAQLETNFFGAVRMTQAVLPHMRERRAGKVIQLSSVGGLFALPMNSAYAASKFALEGYSEALRYELLPFHVYVSLIEPGQVNTDTLETSVRLTDSAHPAYQGAARIMVNKMRSEAGKTGLSVASVVARTVQVVNTPKPKLRYPIGGIAQFLPILKFLTPGMFERMIFQRFQPMHELKSNTFEIKPQSKA
jgi:NAD(P)-dependent dehydrogenase (short-subunit alcohol dehydrogenase family)